MKRLLAFSFVFFLSAGVMLWSQFSHVQSEVGPNALLYLVADTQHELTRLPAAFTRLPDDKEIKVGASLAKLYTVRSDNAPDYKPAQEYVERVGRKLQPLATRKLPYQFHYVPDPGFVNAFALPGGQIFIGDGLLALFDSEDELAAVLAHEIEHVDRYHCAERLQVEAALRRIPAGAILELPIELFQAGYSKEQEMDADREGMRLLVRAGYSPTGMVRVMQAFARLYDEVKRPPRNVADETERVIRETLQGYFRSHPLPAERIAEMEKVIAAENVKTLAERHFEIEYIYLARRAEHELRDKRLPAAVEFANRAIVQNPDHERALYVRTAAQLIQGDAGAATADYRRLATMNSGAAGQVESLVAGNISGLLRKHDWNAANELADRMLLLQPNIPSIISLKIRALVYAGRERDALDAMATMQKLYSASANELVSAMASEGAAEFAAQHYGESVPALSFVAHGHETAESWRALGKALFSLGRFSEASGALESAITKAHPVELDLDLYRRLADSLAASQTTDMIARFEASAKRDQRAEHANDISIERMGLRVMAQQGAAVGKEWRDAVAGGNLAPESAERLSWWYLRAGQPGEAEALLRQALALRPAKDGLRYSLVWTAMEQGKQAAVNAESLGECLLNAQPLLLSPTMAEAIANWRNRKFDDAITLFDRAAKRAPEWRNAAWRDSLQPPGIARVTGELQKESDRRREVAAKRLKK